MVHATLNNRVAYSKHISYAGFHVSPLSYLLLKSGLRFSVNAVMPSIKSAVVVQVLKLSISAFNCCSKLLCIDRLINLLVLARAIDGPAESLCANVFDCSSSS